MKDREAEIAQLGALYGAPHRQTCVLHVNQDTYRWWTEIKPKRRSEVVLFIRRANGNLILHSKDFYPEGTLRVPSGGIKSRETVLQAALREAHEETGLQVGIERFLAVIEFEFQFEDKSLAFGSCLFLLRELGGELRSRDAHERISAFVEVPPSELMAVAQRLEALAPAWRDWGHYRALPHRVAAKLLQEDPTGTAQDDT